MSFPSSPPERPRPIYTAPADGGRLVPAGWLDQAPVTRALLALNIGVFVMQALAAHSATAITSKSALGMGASYALATIGENRWETLVTACFLHGGIVHLGFNMLALWQAGPLVERAVGSGRMAPMYLFAGALGNALSVAVGWATRSGSFSVGASGAISGVIAAALVVGWRVQGWKGPLTRVMAQWLGFVVIFGVLSNLGGANIDNAAHIGGALGGAAIAATWKRGKRYGEGATNAILVVCVAVLAACVALLAVHDRTDRFATMTLQDRFHFTEDAMGDGRCRDAHDGLCAVERLRGSMAPVTSLRDQVEATCGHVLER